MFLEWIFFTIFGYPGYLYFFLFVEYIPFFLGVFSDLSGEMPTTWKVEIHFYTPSPILKLRFNELACFGVLPQRNLILNYSRLIKIHIYSTKTGRFLLFSCRIHTPFFK